MKRALQHDAYPDRHDEPHRDLVLGAPALLGIFFSFAILCAVCFGFGYSSSRGFHMPSPNGTAYTPPVDRHPMPLGGSSTPGEDSAATVDPETQQEEAALNTSPGAGLRAKPAPGVSAPGTEAWPPGEGPPASARTPVPSPDQPPVAQPSGRTGARQAVDFGVALPEAAPAARNPAASAPGTAPLAAAGSAPVVALGMMVQIAAVTRAADAQTLALALRHDGFAAVVRTSTQDQYFHVQVGPFPSFQAAKAMRSRLAGNGYNAFIKP